MNKAERIKVANAEWHRLNEIDTEIRRLFDKLMYEMETLDHYEHKYSGYWIENADHYKSKLIRCNELRKKIAMLMESKGD
jgi:hypothetical protein